MKRLAIFVEGQTELIFVGKLVLEIAGDKNVQIVEQNAITKKGKRVFQVISGKMSLTLPKNTMF